MASGYQYSKFDNDDFDSTDFIDTPSSRERRDPPLESVTEFFTSAFDGNISELREQVNRLREITESVEKFHRGATVGSLSGSVMGAAGGITSIVGLVLAPFTLGASLIVTGVGVGVAAAGGITGAASNISDMNKQKTSRKEIETILNTFQNTLSPILNHLEEIELRLDEIQRDDPTDPSMRKAQIGMGVGRGVGYTAELLRLVNVVEIGKVAAQVSRTVRAASAVTGVVSGLFLVLDVVFIARDAKELYDIDNDQQDGNGKSDISEFITTMNNTVGHLTETLDQIQQVRDQFIANINNR